MEKEILEIISKNLPAQVGDTLKQRLEQATYLEGKVKELENEKVRQAQLITTLQTEASKHQAISVREANVSAREEKVYKEEVEMRIKTLEVQLAAAAEKTQFAKDVALGLVRNIEYRKEAFGHTSETRDNQYGGTNIHHNPTSNTETTTVN